MYTCIFWIIIYNKILKRRGISFVLKLLLYINTCECFMHFVRLKFLSANRVVFFASSFENLVLVKDPDSTFEHRKSERAEQPYLSINHTGKSETQHSCGALKARECLTVDRARAIRSTDLWTSRVSAASNQKCLIFSVYLCCCTIGPHGVWKWSN